MTPLHESLNRFRSLAGLQEAAFDPESLSHISGEQDLRHHFGDQAQVYLLVFTDEGPEDITGTIDEAFNHFDAPSNAVYHFAGVINPQNAAAVIRQECITEIGDPEAIMSGHAIQGAEWMFNDNGVQQMALFTFTQPGLGDDGDEEDPDGDADFWLMVPLRT